jgi:16S rRNA (uracil1498-N3)-methyltransferase
MDVRELPWYHAALPDGAGSLVRLEGDEWHHARHVLRLGPGDQVILFDGLGACFIARMETADRQSGQFILVEHVAADDTVHHTGRFIIALAPTKQLDRTEFALEKITELGVDEIILLDCDHSERQHVRLDRLQKILVGAAKQSRKPVLPLLDGLFSPIEAVGFARHRHPDLQVLCAHLSDTTGMLFDTCRPRADVMVLIGPEGGFSEAEVRELRAGGADLVSLGPHRLRVETAAIAACVALHLRNEHPDAR